jgi:hypothetical protein
MPGSPHLLIAFLYLCAFRRILSLRSDAIGISDLCAVLHREAMMPIQGTITMNNQFPEVSLGRGAFIIAQHKKTRKSETRQPGGRSIHGGGLRHVWG